ncbi:MAG: hydrogenase maturation protein [Proteobacteria bacterium]|nr:hydrogenase maturation protein [Pseudomonadota bacterium]
MRILFLTHAFNSLTQRLFVELKDKGHEVSVEFDINDAVSVEAVSLYQPDLIIAPFLKRAIPETIWRNNVCLIVHPGIKGDRGPSALDWAILGEEETWGVTVLQAVEEMDAGDIWASIEFPMRKTTKASLYRDEVSTAAMKATHLAVERFESGTFAPEPLDYSRPDVKGKLKPSIRIADRAIDWHSDTTGQILRKVNCADSSPGLRDEILGRLFNLFDVHPEPVLKGKTGEIIAKCGPAICRATVDGALWIGHLRDPDGRHPFKLPATQILAEELRNLPEVESGYCDIIYEEEGNCGYLHFNFYNGAMGIDQCERLLVAYRKAKQCDTKVIVLMGGRDFWSNGIHLNLIEAADSPAEESWRNINAMDDLVQEIIETESHVTVSALGANAGAGGVFLARAADQIWGRVGVIINPHYKDMGNLYGSEFWTYLLPRYVGDDKAHDISQACLPMGMVEAVSMGLVDEVLKGGFSNYQDDVKRRASALSDKVEDLLVEKTQRRQKDESVKPLIQYRKEELAEMQLNFFGLDPSYHVARNNFVYKTENSRTPLAIAIHRSSRSGLKKIS